MILLRTKYMNFLIMLMFVFSTGGLLFVFNRNNSFLVLAVMVLFSIFFNRHSIKKSKIKVSFLTFLFVSSFFVLNFLVAPTEQSLIKYSFFGITIFTTILTLFYFKNQQKELLFLTNLYKVLKLILYHSLISFVAYYFIKDQLFLITSKYHESLTFHYLFYYSPDEGSILNLFGIEFCRNAGIFWEAGILQVYLQILFFLEINYFNKDKKLLALTLLGVLTTYSTTGLALIILQIIYFLVKEAKTNIVITSLVLVSLLFPLNSLFTANIKDKVTGQFESSFQKRLFDLTQPFFIALEYPLTGVGLDLDRFNEVRERFYISSDLNPSLNRLGIEQKVETTSKGSTNSVMYLLAGMGFPTATLFIWMFFKQQIITKHRIFWFIITFVSVMSSPLLLRPFFLMFIVSGFMNFLNKIIVHKKQLV